MLSAMLHHEYSRGMDPKELFLFSSLKKLFGRFVVLSYFYMKTGLMKDFQFC